MTSQTGKQYKYNFNINNIHILPNISRSKGNQIIRFGHLIEYNMRDVFPGKPNKM